MKNFHQPYRFVKNVLSTFDKPELAPRADHPVGVIRLTGLPISNMIFLSVLLILFVALSGLFFNDFIYCSDVNDISNSSDSISNISYKNKPSLFSHIFHNPNMLHRVITSGTILIILGSHLSQAFSRNSPIKALLIVFTCLLLGILVPVYLGLDEVYINGIYENILVIIAVIIIVGTILRDISTNYVGRISAGTPLIKKLAIFLQKFRPQPN